MPHTYKDEVTHWCTQYATNPLARFIGYNTSYGSRMYGTLNSVAKSQCIETPVCENLMMGLALGMSLEGYAPVVCFERHDFLLIALDALVNHMDKMPWLSGGQYKFPVIVRAIVGAAEPLNPGPQHTQDYKRVLRATMKYTEVYEPFNKTTFKRCWTEIVGNTISGAVVIVEHRDRYDWILDESTGSFKGKAASSSVTPPNPTGACKTS